MVVCMSFLEFQQPALSDEKAWFTLATTRSADIKRVAGGWHRLLRDLLNYVFFGEGAIAHAGIALPLDAPVLLWFKLGAIMSDNEGLKTGFNTKGFGGLRTCLKCYNCWQKGKAPPTHFDYTEFDFDKFIPMQPATLVEYVRRLSDSLRSHIRGETSKKALEDLEKGLGINADLRSPLFMLVDRPELAETLLSSIRFDWMHGFVSNGTFADEVHRILKKSLSVGMTMGAWKEVRAVYLHPPYALDLSCKRACATRACVHSRGSAHNTHAACSADATFICWSTAQ